MGGTARSEIVAEIGSVRGWNRDLAAGFIHPGSEIVTH